MQVLQVQLEIRPDPTEVGRARRWARSRLAGSGVADDEPLAETLILLVSELVTNAVVHTGCPAVLRLSFQGAPQGAVAGGFVRLEVADLSPCPPAPRHADGDETNGRGLELVDGLADRWGWSPEGVGKRIWCELDRCPAPPVPYGGGSGSAVAATASATASATAATRASASASTSVTASAYGGMAAYEAV
uniref:ATP-binding protein n=1 Tax=Streptomyces sp. NBC_00093 TaxID=2975649 RepID=A0AAU2A5D3_9ACTN